MDYRPGTCNIGTGERRRRWVIGVAALLVASVIAAADLPPPVQAPSLFLALFFGFEGVYQGYLGFCTGYAHLGRYDMSESGDVPQAVQAADARRQDLSKALQLHAAAVFSAVFTTVVMHLV